MIQDTLYNKFIAQGYSKKEAAKEAQMRTGISMVTGKPIRSKKIKFIKKGIVYGQQNAFKFSSNKFGQY